MTDLAELVGPRLIAIGACDDSRGRFGVAWETETGHDWRRILETPTGVIIRDVSTDGRPGGAVLVGHATDFETALAWSGDVWNGFDAHELPAPEGGALVRAVAWDGSRFLAVGDDVGSSRAAAWLDTGDGSGWQLTDPPPGAVGFLDVTVDDEAVPRSFLVAGSSSAGSSTWRLAHDGTWSEIPLGADGHLDEFLDARTAVGGGALWVQREGEWHRQSIGSGISPSAAVRLGDGYLVVGGPDGKNPRPLVVVTSRNGVDWSVVRETLDRQTTIYDLALFNDRVIGVGLAVYAGPVSVANYD